MSELIDSVKEMYVAFKNGNTQAILGKLDPNVKWEFEAPSEISFAGNRTGTKGAADFFEGIAKEYKDSNLEMIEFLESADTVAAFGRYKATSKSTGNAVDSPAAHLFKFRDGKVVRYVNFLNTASLLTAQTPRKGAAIAHENFLNKLFQHWAPVTLVHTLMFLLLVVGTMERIVWPLYVAVAVFTVWDLLWIGCSPPDRTAQEVLDTSARARTYTSYYVAVYGAGLAYFLLRMGSQEQSQVFAIVNKAGVPLAFLLAPFVLPAIAMLFFPIRVGRGAGVNLASKEPTGASLAHLLINAWTEKVATFCFVYTVAMIGSYLAH